MTTALPGYLLAVSALEAVLGNLPPRIVGVDGRNGVGKTTFGRYLAWHFNVTLIETDLFANEGSVLLGYRLADINRLIQLRLDKPRPVVVEGVALLRLLEQLHRSADFLIYCESANHEPDESLSLWLDEYDRAYTPKSRADISVRLELGGS